jgi:ribosomal protein S18 acetylase RimI-like enzyme
VVSARPAGPADRDALHRLYRDFFREAPPAAYEELTVEDELPEVDEIVASGLAFVAERGGEPVGFALARRRRGGEGRITDLYVRPDVRRHGGAAALVRAAASALRERGVTHVTLWVDARNADARAVYRRWGFREERLALVAEVAALDARLARSRGGSFGSIHVQTDDVVAVERAVRQFVPRLPGGSQGSVVAPPRNGWIAVYDELCDRDPRMLRRLARELSDRMGAVVLALGVEEGDVVHYDLLERGRVVDEYLSVPEYHGPRPPGEVVSLSSNPRLLARLTGGDQERIRSVARTATSSADLPPAPELLAELAVALELPGGQHGYEGAEGIEGAVRIAGGTPVPD